ncbi:stringent starvation protein B [Aliidiomarina maris]|nr:stringent starvation protein B [Aliidiomarina maris]
MDLQMTPQRPYLLRALYDWLLDNQCTPHVVVDTEQAFVEVPQEHIQDGQIVLNIHPDAVTRFNMDLEHISFEARFSGSARRIWLPMAAIIAIYARENGAGTMFEPEPGLFPQENQADSQDAESEPHAQPAPSAPNKGKPSLKVVK